MNVARWIEAWAGHMPERTALRFGGEVIGYAALAERLAQRAGTLRALGVAHGDRVAFLGYNNPELIVLLFACARLGAIVLPLNWRLTAPEHDFVLDDAGVKVLIAEARFREHCETLGALPADAARVLCDGEAPGWQALDALEPRAGAEAGRDHDPLLLVYTSGTTGRPKGALLTQAALQWNAVNSQHAHDLTTADHVLTDLPLFHVGGLNIQTLPALHCGAEVTLHPRFDPGAALAAFAALRPSVYLMVPATMRALLDHPGWAQADLGSLRAVMAGSSTIPLPLLEAFLARGVAVGQIYGATETAPIASVLRCADAARKLGSCGKAATHCALRVVDTHGRVLGAGGAGEIQVRGANLLREYWGDPAATREAFDGEWFRSGDIGHWDEDGYLYVDERRNDVIISGGENVYPAEIENLLSTAAALAECAVIGRPDPRWGEVPVAVVVPRPGEHFDHEDTLALLRERLARFKLPARTLVVDALPRNAMGKVQKHLLRRQVAALEADPAP